MAKYICGKNSVLDAIKSGVNIKVLYVLKPFELKNSSILIKIISKKEMNNLTYLNHQGYLAILDSEFNYLSLDKIIKEKPNIILVLDHIEDPHNLGAIIRTANAAGVKDLIIPKNRSASINEIVFKVSSGGLININIAKVNSLQVAINKLKKNNFWIYVSTLEHGYDYKKINYNFPLVLIIGNEANGVSKTLIKQSDQNVFIPMNGTVQSLNVSVATGIMLFEIIKNLY